MRTLRRSILVSLSLLLALAIPGDAFPAAFPDKPIEFTVPFAAGGGSDIALTE